MGERQVVPPDIPDVVEHKTLASKICPVYGGLLLADVVCPHRSEHSFQAIGDKTAARKELMERPGGGGYIHWAYGLVKIHVFLPDLLSFVVL